MKTYTIRNFLVAAAVLSFAISTQAAAQSTTGTVSGTISDGTGALIPGVSITATNTGTSVATSVFSNEAGVYNLVGLVPGVYTVKTELPGFQTQTYTDVQLGNAAQVRLNFRLQVAGVNTAVEVSVAVDTLLATSSSSVGAVLAEKTVQNLPIIGTRGNDVLDLIRTLPGVTMTDAPLTPNNTTFAGVSASNVLIQRDGVDASASGRWPAGANSATNINPDLVGEVRMILSPVDAEVGRGNAQIQVLTRSGTNQYRGSAVYTVQNSALDANTWVNNRVPGKPTPRPWRNMHEGTVSLGGPIVKNRTFFFALADALIPRSHHNINARVLTPCARNGIYRYYDNWNNGNALAVTTSGATPTTAVVDGFGNPKAPATNPNGTPHNGVLRHASVFGRLMNTPTRPDCSDAIVQGPSWDPFRTQLDPTGFVTKQMSIMPAMNNGDVGDGLNMAGHRWESVVKGIDNRFGVSEAANRKQFNIKIDHNFNASHKLNASYSYERNYGDNYGQSWPVGFRSYIYRWPQVLTTGFTSTLSPTIVNEARFGMRRTGVNSPSPFHHPNTGEEALAWFPEINEIPVVPQLGGTNPSLATAPIIGFRAGQPYGNIGHSGGESNNGSLFPATIYEVTPLWTYTDTLSWTRSTHSFKIGGELRFASSRLEDQGTSNDWSAHARVIGGETPLTPVQGVNTTNFPGIAGTATAGNQLGVRDMMNYLAGSISRATQLYYINSPDKLNAWEAYADAPYRIRELRQKEFSAFIKDDWKLHRDLTLNVGLRYEFYGLPYVASGLTARPVGGGNALFGYSGRSFADWMRPGQRGEDTVIEFVGPNSPNPDAKVWNKDINNFGPAIGFAWQVPWLGAGQTTVRGGYQITYQLGGGRFNTYSGPLSNPPGSSYQATYTGGPGKEYLDMREMQSIIPVLVPIQPMQKVPVTARDVPLTTFDPNMTTPYIQNLTLAVTRSIGQRLTIDARYVGTLGRKLYSSIDINSANFLYNGLKDAFDAARSGGESVLLDDMFRGINIAGAGYGAVGTTFNGVPQTGAQHLRAATANQIRNNLANGNYVVLANTLNTLNYSRTGGLNATLPVIPAGVNGAVLRYNGFPENFIKTNPQFTSAILETNLGNTNYHSLQAQTTLRAAAGVTVQGTYTWSRFLGNGTTATFTNPVDRRGDYTLQPSNRRHDFRTNGTFELPVGPQKLLFGNSSGVLARVIEGWQMSWIVNLTSGPPATIVGNNSLYGNGVPDIAGPFSVNSGKVRWADGAVAGTYFEAGSVMKVPDPQCAAIAADLRGVCTLGAIADARSGQVLLQNARPGTRGNLGQNVLEQPGRWRFDGSIGKSFKISETKTILFRADAENVFNHPEPSNPVLDINSTEPFGNVATKAGIRRFQATLRLSF